jgi:hypothetical protein
VPVAEFEKLLAIKLVGHSPQRVISLLGKTEATQDVNQPLPAIRRMHPQPCLQCDTRGMTAAGRIPSERSPADDWPVMEA